MHFKGNMEVLGTAALSSSKSTSKAIKTHHFDWNQDTKLIWFKTFYILEFYLHYQCEAKMYYLI